jgi:TP901 family phage tail tape measure protein
MAVEKEVKILFEGVDSVSSVIGGIGNKLDDFGGKVVSATQPLADLADAVLKTEAALAAMAIGGLAYAVTEAGRFGDSFNEISTLISVPQEKLDQFRQDILSYATDSRQSIDQINAGVYQAISAGVEWTQSLEFMAAAEKLAVGGKAELSSAVGVLAGVLNAYGASVDEATDYSDALFTAVRLGVTTMPELASSLGNVTAIAAAGKVPFADLLAAVDALTLAGVPTSQAVTAMRAAIQAIIAPTVEARNVAKELGIDIGQTALETRGLQGYMEYLETATGGNVETMRRMVGSVEALNAILILGKDTSGAFANALKEMENRAGATEAAYKKMADNFTLINQLIVNNFRAVAIEIGGPLLDEYAQIAGALADVFKGISVGIDRGAFDPLFHALEQIGADIARFFAEIAAVMPEALEQLDFTGFLDSLRNLGNEFSDLFRAFFGDVDLTTAEGLADVLQKVVDGITALTNVTAGILSAWEPFIKALSAGVEKFSESGEAAQTFVGNVLGFGQAVNTVAGQLDILTAAISIIAGALSVLSGTQLVAAIGGFGALGAAAISLTAALYPLPALAAAVGAGLAIDAVLERVIPNWEQHRDAISENIDVMHGFDMELEGVVDSSAEAESALNKQKTIWDELSDAIDAMPPLVETQVDAPGAALTKEEIDGIVKAFAEIDEDKQVNVSADIDETSVKRVKDIIIEELPDGRIILTQLRTDQSSIDQAKNALDKDLPTERQIEITLQGEIDKEIARINASAETLQASFKYKAEVDIAEIENLFDTLQNQSDNIADMFNNTGDVLASLADSLGSLSSLARLEVFELMEEESRRRDALLLEQQKLTEAQIKYLAARTDAMKQGDGIITINATGIEAELDMVLRRIIELAQIRANEEGLNFLLGVA